MSNIIIKIYRQWHQDLHDPKNIGQLADKLIESASLLKEYHGKMPKENLFFSHDNAGYMFEYRLGGPDVQQSQDILRYFLRFPKEKQPKIRVIPPKIQFSRKTHKELEPLLNQYQKTFMPSKTSAEIFDSLADRINNWFVYGPYNPRVLDLDK